MATISTAAEIPYGEVGDTCVFGKHQVKSETAWGINCTIVHKDAVNKSLILMADKIIDLRAFDAAESSNSDSNRKSYGNNQWRYSNIRQWLNSSAAAGAWYSAQHSADASPSTTASVSNQGTQYSSRPGFLYNFSTEERALLQLGTITTNLPDADGGGQNTTKDMVFLPSFSELGITAQNSESLETDAAFDLYVGAQNKDRIAYMSQQAFNNTSSASKPTNANTAWIYWLRSPYVSGSNLVRFVLTDGSLYSYYAYHGYDGVRPCFRIAMATGLDVIDKFMVLPAPSSISYLSPVRTLTGPSSKLAVALDYVVDGSFVTVQACNNAYDESPTWEDVTKQVSANSVISLKNTTKTADNWGLQIKVIIDKSDAPWVSSRGIAYAILNE